MGKMVIRILRAEINNFQNVEHGALRFACNLKDDIFESSSDILGIYGQNGSGKTTFIHALSVLDALLSGRKLPKETVNFITKDKDTSHFSFEFGLNDVKNFYRVIYDFSITKRERDTWEEDDEANTINPVIVSYEKIRYSYLENGIWSKLRTLIDCNLIEEKVFRPDARLQDLTGGSSKIVDELRVAKKLAIKQSTSFVFSKETQKQIVQNCTVQSYKQILRALYLFGRFDLYIIGNRDSGLISLNMAIPFSFRMERDNSLSMGSIFIRLDKPSVIPEEIYILVGKVIEVMNTVLCEIIPGLQVGLLNMGKQIMQDGTEGISVEMVSIRNERKIPLRYESEGIKKIISILHMLIAMHNNPSMTLAIDELDSGIFEYLLGELLKVVRDSGKGQLIFTSHNLRPLEMLHKSSILFTTTNPNNRYIRLTNVKTNNNLRDLYYHDLILGGQKESIYEATNSFAIARALRMAGANIEK
ncbi:AAA family ATPase [Phosphitispora fastidiosa]|uniref:AAA family ATPase n=1 Tax=Phosphitispora fastidiosa TaxID=2837202 RepID=UPI001E33068C|nr:AAA family ATPase [Phosphitispora fastidiosa]MBU7006238.1 AAA15 family ATPase/GTPase [Phosphitispora fastidiosa]